LITYNIFAFQLLISLCFLTYNCSYCTAETKAWKTTEQQTSRKFQSSIWSWAKSRSPSGKYILSFCKSFLKKISYLQVCVIWYKIFANMAQDLISLWVRWRFMDSESFCSQSYLRFSKCNDMPPKNRTKKCNNP